MRHFLSLVFILLLAGCTNVSYNQLAGDVKINIEARLNPEFEGMFKIMMVPNITNICYGRGVGYKIEEIVLPDEIQKISATKIRAKMREEGKIK